MKLLVYSWFPVRAGVFSGGAQLLMHDLLCSFAKAGLHVTVLCPEYDRRELLDDTSHLKILPILRRARGEILFPHDHLYNLSVLEQAAQEADVVWTLDHSIPIELPKPIVLTLDIFCYPEEMSSLLSLNWDMLVVPSSYLYRVAHTVVGPDFWTPEPRPIQIIPNSVDTSFFTPTDPYDLCQRLAISPQDQYLIFPHRADPNKGFDTALRTLSALHQRNPAYKLLLPINRTWADDQEYYAQLQASADALGIGSAIIFHEWISHQDLPAYYSLAQWCLTLSKVPEGFGLTPVQSIACGTPTVATRCGALAELMPPNSGVRYVDYDNVDQIVEAILTMPSPAEMQRGRAFITEHYSVEQQVKLYCQCFDAARKSSARYRLPGKRTRPVVSPWCHITGPQTIWHDYFVRELTLSEREMAVVKTCQDGSDQDLNLRDWAEEVDRLSAQGVLLL